MHLFHIRHSHIFLAAAMAITVPASAQSVFGFEFGKPLVLPECEFKQYAKIKAYDPLPEQTCFHEPFLINTYKIPVRRIIFGKSEHPDIVKYWQIIALEIDNTLQGIEFFTLGASSQDAVLDSLTKKFGKPSSVSTKSVQTATSAPFQAIHATWKTDTLIVTFDGITDRLDRGQVFIDSPQGSALRASWAAETSAAKRGL
jgi:hypothetical protein